jgi:hypothetical protein
MAIGKGSLFSFKTQGRIGKNTLLRTVKGQTVAGAFSASHKPTTAAQSAARANYQAGCLLWRSMSASDKAAWAAQRPQLSTNKGFSNFIQWFLEGGETMNINEVKGLDVGYSPPPRFVGIWDAVNMLTGCKLILLNNASAAQYDEVEYDLIVPAGTFQVEIGLLFWTFCPIVELSLDGVVLTAIDLYVDVPLTGSVLVGTPQVFAAAASHTVKICAVDVNPLGAYYLGVSDILFRRTA